MKKILLTILLFMSLIGSLQAQTYDEWFRQKKTKKKYLLQQIAALKVYVDYAQKGYRISREGLGSIGQLIGSEFALHTDYFKSLEDVNSNVRSHPNVAKMISLQTSIMQEYNVNRNLLGKNDYLTDAELRYVNRVLNRLMDDCEANLEELLNLTADGSLKMADDERLARIDKLYADTQDNYTFSKKFSNETKALAVSREREARDVLTSRSLYGKKSEQ